MVNPVKKTCKRKVVDETRQVALSEKGIIREQVWQDSQGKVVKDNLAFINHSLRAEDNGGVLGYDNSHGITIGMSRWSASRMKCEDAATRRSRYEVENQHGWI